MFKNIFILIAFTSVFIFAQPCIKIQYTYDETGNRITHNYINVNDCNLRKSTDSIANINENIKVVLYPNPVQEALRISVIGSIKKDSQIQLILFDMNGKQIEKNNNLTGEYEMQFSLRPIGTYLVNIMIDNKTFQYKIIKN